PHDLGCDECPANLLLIRQDEGLASVALAFGALLYVRAAAFAFLGGLPHSNVSHLDAELRARVEELRASRARLVEAGESERRRLERDLHDGPSRGWSGSRSCCAPRGPAPPRAASPRPCPSARRTSCRRAWASCGSWPAASTRPC
ncbi:MAG: hypothetical protein ACR2L8_17610, partial [Solirubrobacteraceae bacterium]